MKITNTKYMCVVNEVDNLEISDNDKIEKFDKYKYNGVKIV